VFFSEARCRSIRSIAESGGRLWVVAPLGRHDESARSRSGDFLDGLGDGVVLIAEEVGSSALVDLIGTGPFSPRIRRISRPASWRIRLRAHRGKLVAHRLNGALSGIDHPNLTELSLPANGGTGERGPSAN